MKLASVGTIPGLVDTMIELGKEDAEIAPSGKGPELLVEPRPAIQFLSPGPCACNDILVASCPREAPAVLRASDLALCAVRKSLGLGNCQIGRLLRRFLPTLSPV